MTGRNLLLTAIAWALPLPTGAEPAKSPPVTTAHVTILSTMLADQLNDDVSLKGEWGFSAVVEANGKRVLFDTGAEPGTVSRNAVTLGIDLSSVTDVVVSHSHNVADVERWVTVRSATYSAASPSQGPSLE